MLRESIRLAFVAALQHLPPKQRAALLLTVILSRSAAKAAETLDSSVASVNSAVRCDANPPGEMQVDVATTQVDPAVYRLIYLPFYLVWNTPAIIQEG